MPKVVITAQVEDAVKWEEGFRTHGELFRSQTGVEHLGDYAFGVQRRITKSSSLYPEVTTSGTRGRSRL